jgi:hypothetical protein
VVPATIMMLRVQCQPEWAEAAPSPGPSRQFGGTAAAARSPRRGAAGPSRSRSLARARLGVTVTRTVPVPLEVAPRAGGPGRFGRFKFKLKFRIAARGHMAASSGALEVGSLPPGPTRRYSPFKCESDPNHGH